MHHRLDEARLRRTCSGMMGMKEYMEGEMILELGDAMDMIVHGMQFKEDDNKIVIYFLRGLNTMVDYLMIPKQDRKCLWDVKEFLVKKQYHNTIW